MFEATVRFRTVSDVTCIGCVESTAATVTEVIVETAVSLPTKGCVTWTDGQISAVGREGRKRQGYF
ncbi:hypothetical protein [Mycobacterium uberis]|uniref:hypothetical protein n=1 Tax=Mycobacterium uberis TaxID=2162698 RepID=UPI003C73771A